MKVSKSVRQVLICCVCLLLLPSFLFAATAVDYYNAGTSFQQREKWYEAIEQYLEAVQLNPAYGEAWYSLSECCYETGEFDLALLYLDQADALIKNRSDLQNLRGFIYICLGRTSDAKALFESILTRYPNDVDARFGLAELEILEGRVSGAEKQYQAALQRQSRNSRAILSLSLVSWELGKTKAAGDYIEQALRLFNGDARVYWFASYISLQQKDMAAAETYIRRALQLKEDYDEAYSLLSDILFMQGRYEEVLEICSYRIILDRNCTNAWYLKGLSETKLGRIENAFISYETGLDIAPQDELMRAALEMLAIRYTDVEDPRREGWAKYHTKKAGEYSDKFLSVQATYEYLRALRLNPFDASARLAYADLLLADGYAESYLSQIQFVQNQGKADAALNNTIEAYTSLLYDTLPQKWDVNPLYLNKKRWTVGIYYQQPAAEDIHQDATRITSLFYADMFSDSSSLSVTADESPASTFTEAFARARRAGYDYFMMYSYTENERELTATAKVYSGRTGNAVTSWSVYRTGNDMFSNAMQKMKEKLNQAMPYYAKIIARNGPSLLLDAGRLDGAAVDQTWDVIAKGGIRTADFGTGITYTDDSVLGTVTFSAVGEEIASGMLVQKGFYDRVNVGDLVVLQKQSLEEEPAVGTDAADMPPVDGQLTASPQEPPLLQLLRKIR